MSDDKTDNPSELDSSSIAPVKTVNEPPDVEFMRRRLLLKGAAAMPVVLTLRASPALASTGNCAVVEMTPKFDPDTKTWSFDAADGLTHTPWNVGEDGNIYCVATKDVNGQQCPDEGQGVGGVLGVFNDHNNPKHWGCKNGGIIIAVSSGGSFTH